MRIRTMILMATMACITLAFPLTAQEIDDEATPEVSDVVRYGGFELTRAELLDRLIARHGAATLEELIAHELIAQAAGKQGISLADETIDDEIMRRLAGIPLDQRQAYLASQGLTLKAARRATHSQLLMQIVVDQTIDVPDEQIQQLFEQEKEALSTPERRLVAHLVFADQDSAHIARAEFAEGNPVDPDIIQLFQRPPAKDLADADALTRAIFYDLVMPGDTAAPIQMPDGWHVVRLDGVMPPKEASLAEYQAAARERIVRALRPERQAEWLDQLIRDADIRRYVTF